MQGWLLFEGHAFFNFQVSTNLFSTIYRRQFISFFFLGWGGGAKHNVRGFTLRHEG